MIGKSDFLLFIEKHHSALNMYIIYCIQGNKRRNPCKLIAWIAIYYTPSDSVAYSG